MNFYSKGDFKIEESWDTNKGNKDTKSRNSQRKTSAGNG